MAAISGSITVFYLFDVAEAIDLAAVPALVGGAPVPARLAPKPATPAYVQYAKPPLLLDGQAIQAGTISGLTSRRPSRAASCSSSPWCSLSCWKWCCSS